MSEIAGLAAKLDEANTTFETALEALSDLLPQSADIFSYDGGPLTGQQLDVSWVENAGGTRERLPGETLTMDGGRAYGAKYPLRTFTRTFSILRKDVEYDENGKVAASIRKFMADLPTMLDERLYATILDTTLTGVDDVALFSNSHPFAPGGGTQDNLAAGTALDASAYEAAKAALRGYQKENAEFVNQTGGTHLIVGQGLERTALEITGAENRPVAVNSSGAEDGTRIAVAAIENVYRGTSTVIVTPRMPADAWMLINGSSANEKPIAYRVGNGGPRAIPVCTTESEVAKTDRYEWLIELDMAAGPAHWMRCYGRPS
ncbi:MAG: hypothetical protein AAGH15_21745 [Myxococcota bacterium]